jgi:hypothetical protein
MQMMRWHLIYHCVQHVNNKHDCKGMRAIYNQYLTPMGKKTATT